MNITLQEKQGGFGVLKRYYSGSACLPDRQGFIGFMDFLDWKLARDSYLVPSMQQPDSYLAERSGKLTSPRWESRKMPGTRS
jgi:hypothetical protein